MWTFAPLPASCPGVWVCHHLHCTNCSLLLASLHGRGRKGTFITLLRSPKNSAASRVSGRLLPPDTNSAVQPCPSVQAATKHRGSSWHVQRGDSLPAGWAAVLLQTSQVSFLHQAQQRLGPNGLPHFFFFGNTLHYANVCIWQSVGPPVRRAEGERGTGDSSCQTGKHLDRRWASTRATSGGPGRMCG